MFTDWSTQFAKMSVLLQCIIRLHTLLIKISARLYTSKKLTVIFVKEDKETSISKTILKKKTNLKDLHYVILRHDKNTTFKIVWYWQNDRHLDQLTSRGSRY